MPQVAEGETEDEAVHGVRVEEAGVDPEGLETTSRSYPPFLGLFKSTESPQSPKMPFCLSAVQITGSIRGSARVARPEILTMARKAESNHTTVTIDNTTALPTSCQ